MNTIDRPSDLYARSMKKLTEQETKLEDTAQTMDTLRAQLHSQQRDLDTFLTSLNVE
jgi:peptidoglycan hydrolase CwlO-like protein